MCRSRCAKMLNNQFPERTINRDKTISSTLDQKHRTQIDAFLNFNEDEVKTAVHILKALKATGRGNIVSIKKLEPTGSRYLTRHQYVDAYNNDSYGKRQG